MPEGRETQSSSSSLVVAKPLVFHSPEALSLELVTSQQPKQLSSVPLPLLPPLFSPLRPVSPLPLFSPPPFFPSLLWLFAALRLPLRPRDAVRTPNREASA